MRLKSIIFFFFFFLPNFAFAFYEQERIVVTIKPLYSLVAGVVGNTANVDLLLSGNSSPHDFQLKPSQMRMLQEADILFFIDDHFEVFLRKALLTGDNSDLNKVEVTSFPDLLLLKKREDAEFEHHHHGEEGEHEDDEELVYDYHLWLDAGNAQVIVKNILDILVKKYPGNKNVYAENARKILQRIASLDDEIAQKLGKLEDRPFIVFHDAYQYFEKRYMLDAVGSIMFDPEQLPSAKHLRDIKQRIREKGVVCVFKEPQFSDKLANLVIEDSGAKLAVLDPLASKITDSEDLYFRLLNNLADNFENCLGGKNEAVGM